MSGVSMLTRFPMYDPAVWIAEAWPRRTAAVLTETTELSWVRRTASSADETLDRLEFDARRRLLGDLAGPRFRDRIVAAQDVRWALEHRVPGGDTEVVMLLSRDGVRSRLLHPAWADRRGRVVCTAEALLLPRPPEWGCDPHDHTE